MENPRGAIPPFLFAGLKGHIFVTVPVLLFVLSAVDGRIVFYVLFFSFQLYTFSLITLAFFFARGDPSPFWARCIRLFVALSWGGICFLVYALIGSVLYASLLSRAPGLRRPRPAKVAVHLGQAPPAAAVAGPGFDRGGDGE